MFGENNPKYIKDRTKIKVYDDRRGDILNKEWKQHVMKRDAYKCRIEDEDCAGKLEIHHILNWIDYPKLRYEINNGITLCHFHHPKGRNKENQYMQLFSELISKQ